MSQQITIKRKIFKGIKSIRVHENFNNFMLELETIDILNYKIKTIEEKEFFLKFDLFYNPDHPPRIFHNDEEICTDEEKIIDDNLFEWLCKFIFPS
jgi:IS4 transposase